MVVTFERIGHRRLAVERVVAVGRGVAERVGRADHVAVGVVGRGGGDVPSGSVTDGLTVEGVVADRSSYGPAGRWC